MNDNAPQKEIEGHSKQGGKYPETLAKKINSECQKGGFRARVKTAEARGVDSLWRPYRAFKEFGTHFHE